MKHATHLTKQVDVCVQALQEVGGVDPVNEGVRASESNKKNQHEAELTCMHSPIHSVGEQGDDNSVLIGTLTNQEASCNTDKSQ